MPANKKYLTTDIYQKTAKITAAIPLSFLVLAAAHMAVSQLYGDYKPVAATFLFLAFPLWIAMMIVPFLFHNGWKCVLLYSGITAFFVLLILLGRA